MTELRRLLESSEHDDERALLLAARGEMPSASGMRDAAIALGLTTVTANALAASVPTAVGTAPALAGSGASVAKVLSTASLSVLGKGLLGGAIVSFLALTTLDHTLSSSSNSAAPLTTTTVRRTAPSAAAPSAERPRSSVPEPDDGPAESAIAPRATTRFPSPPRIEARRQLPEAPARSAFEPAPVAPVGRTNRAASLARETELLDRTRRALAVGDLGQADRTLASYYAAAPSPVLALEAIQLKARLLVARGDRPAAAALARRTIQSHPESVHVPFLQQLANEP